MSKKVYVANNLKTLEEYMEELKEIHSELGFGIETGTLIKSDLELLTRADELVVIIDWLKRQDLIDKGVNND